MKHKWNNVLPCGGSPYWLWWESLWWRSLCGGGSYVVGGPMWWEHLCNGTWWPCLYPDLFCGSVRVVLLPVKLCLLPMCSLCTFVTVGSIIYCSRFLLLSKSRSWSKSLGPYIAIIFFLPFIFLYIHRSVGLSLCLFVYVLSICVFLGDKKNRPTVVV